MSAPYEKIVQFAVDSGEDNFFAIPFPHRGILSKFHLVQASGVNAGFTVDLYNSEHPSLYAIGSVDSLSDASDTDFANEAYQIFPTQTVAAAANDVLLAGQTHRYPYRNVDGTFSVPKSFLHVRIRPAGTGTKVFQLALAVVPPV